MGASTLSVNGIKGEFYQTLKTYDGAAWMNPVSMYFKSDQAGEDYAWLGQSPAMREWVGGRQAKGFIENGIRIENKHFEGSIEVSNTDLRRDKTGQILMRIGELAERTTTHWATLMSALILDGASNICYDGQFFFDVDHAEGQSGAQSNKINVDISTLPVQTEGTVTNPSVEQMQQAVLKAVTQISSFVDDQGEPMNTAAMNFIVLVPSSLAFVGMNAFLMPRGTGVTEQLPVNLNISILQNPLLNTWTDKFVVIRTDGRVKPFIRQEETPVRLNSIGVGSEMEFKYDKYIYGVDTWRNVGFGYWQHACLVTLT